MKKRRTLIISLLLVAALTLGIGYAALTDDLFVTGSAGINSEHAEDAFGQDIYFTKALISDNKGTATIGLDAHDEAADKVTIEVKDGALAGAGDNVVCAMEITNAGDLDANVKLNGIVVSNSEFFKVTTSWGSNDTQTLEAGGTLDVVVTITVVKTPTVNVNTTFDLTFTATAVEPAQNP